jgi:hypothetical protein
MEVKPITPQQINNELGAEPTPTWIMGQNICNLRDMDPKEVAGNRKIVLLMIREAYNCGILAYDSRGFWTLNTNFGDIMSWIHRKNEIMEIIYQISVDTP